MASSYNDTVLTEIIDGEVAKRGRGAQTRLAEAVGVTVQTVNKWVAGQTQPEPERWGAIEEHFDLPDGYIASRVVLKGRVDVIDALTEQVLALAARVDRLERELRVPTGRSKH